MNGSAHIRQCLNGSPFTHSVQSAGRCPNQRHRSGRQLKKSSSHTDQRRRDNRVEQDHSRRGFGLRFELVVQSRRDHDHAQHIGSEANQHHLARHQRFGREQQHRDNNYRDYRQRDDDLGSLAHSRPIPRVPAPVQPRAA